MQTPSPPPAGSADASTNAGAQHTPATTRIQRRFEKWELQHLRALAAELAARVDTLETDLQREQRDAEFWRGSHFELQQHLEDDTEDGRAIGLTKSGELLVIRTGALQ